MLRHECRGAYERLKMEIQISGKAEEFVKTNVTSGAYTDAAAFVTDILLRAEEFDRIKLERLRREIQFGLDELNRGEGMPLDMDEINLAIDRELGYVKRDRA